jgi:hypothetical protein
VVRRPNLGEGTNLGKIVVRRPNLGEGTNLGKIVVRRPNLGEGTNLRKIVLVRRAEPRVGHDKDGVAAAPRQVRRVWPMLWPTAKLPAQYPSAAAGVLAAMTRRHDDDLARWALKRGPGWSRRWPTPRLQDVPGTGSVIAERS